MISSTVFTHSSSTDVSSYMNIFNAPSDDEHIYREKKEVTKMSIGGITIVGRWALNAETTECGLSGKKLTEGKDKDFIIGKCGCAFYREAFIEYQTKTPGMPICPGCNIPWIQKVFKKPLNLKSHLKKRISSEHLAKNNLTGNNIHKINNNLYDDNIMNQQYNDAGEDDEDDDEDDESYVEDTEEGDVEFA